MASSEEAAGRLLQREDAVLAVIDVQERLLPHVMGGEEVVANIVKLLRFARIIDLPVLLTEQQKLGPTVPKIAAELPGLEPITKLEFGCFGCESFTEALSALRRRTLLLAGIEAHICVAQTALQALQEHSVHIVSDAIASRSPLNKEVALQRLAQAGAVITSTEMAMHELLARAGTDEFRAVLPLVKGD